MNSVGVMACLDIPTLSCQLTKDTRFASFRYNALLILTISSEFKDLLILIDSENMLDVSHLVLSSALSFIKNDSLLLPISLMILLLYEYYRTELQLALQSEKNLLENYVELAHKSNIYLRICCVLLKEFKLTKSVAKKLIKHIDKDPLIVIKIFFSAVRGMITIIA